MKPRGLGGLTCFGHTGKRKRRYGDKHAAEVGLPDFQAAYPCQDCQGWHRRTKRR